jgi:antitoxin (DNA-binding transcriptional repressor) of toxin-antitoxin stability system
MKTLSVTTARKNLGQWIARAQAGEEIGILCGEGVVALRPVQVEASDYAQREYGLSAEELDRAAKRIHEKGEKDKKAGKVHVFTGDIESLLEHRNRRRLSRTHSAALKSRAG